MLSLISTAIAYFDRDSGQSKDLVDLTSQLPPYQKKRLPLAKALPHPFMQQPMMTMQDYFKVLTSRTTRLNLLVGFGAEVEGE